MHLLWASIAATLIGLGGLAVFLHLASVRIDAMNSLIADDTGPSIVAIESINVHLSELRSLLREHLLTPGEEDAREASIATERDDLARSVTRYLSLPVDPGEDLVMEDLKRHLERFEGVRRRILATTPSTPQSERERLRTELDASATALDQVLVTGSNLNAQLAYEAAEELRRVKRQILPGAIAFEAASTVAAIVAVGAAYWMSRREKALAERQALQERNAELEAFSARVAHDLLSPLMTVSLALGVAEQRLSASADERIRLMLVRAGSSLQRVRQMVSDLLEFARASAKPLSGVATAVAPLLQGVVGDLQPLASSAGVDLRLSSGSVRGVRCAAGILTSMIGNLVQNAIRHASKAAERVVEVRAVDDGSEVRFEIEDSGAGVDLQDREVIFEPYVSHSNEGSGLGLGLATVKRLAESHGGRVGVSSEPGHGALFWVALPAAERV